MAETQTAAATAAGDTTSASGFGELLKNKGVKLDEAFKVKKEDSQKRARVETAVQTLVDLALTDASVVSDDVLKTIDSMIASIDRKLTAQINQILHHPDFQKLEGTWRGLHYMVSNTETDTDLKIKVFNVTKEDLGKTFKKFKGVAFDQSPIFKKIYTEGFSQWGADVYGCLVGDFHFDHSQPDVDILAGMAQVASAAHCPFIAGASASVLNMDSFQELQNPVALDKIFTTPEYAAWRSLRQSEDARYLGLAMPRFLARAPYDPKNNPADGFTFVEDAEGGDHSKYTWSNAAYAMGRNIARSYKEYGWCARIRGIESGGRVDDLPLHTFPTTDGGVDMKCPAEIAIDDRREKELADTGFMPLLHCKGENYAAFIGAQSLQAPKEYSTPEATASANLSARLPYLFAACRFAHYLKAIVRDKVGSFKERDEMQTWLHNWIIRYVVSDTKNASEKDKAERPLAEAKVTVVEVPGNPGFYDAVFHLRPHYQLEGLKTSLRLVSKVPGVGK